jgi:DNA-binding transcriptional regulator GbsR (MarR family)
MDLHQVTDLSSNAQENIAHAAQTIGRSSHRRKVFSAIYTGKKMVKTATEISRATGLPVIRVLQEAKKLADNNVVKSIRKAGRKAYEKIGFFHSHKKRILSLAESPEKLRQYPTKRNPTSASQRVLKLVLKTRPDQARRLSVDDLESFKRVRSLRRGDDSADSVSEIAFKKGLLRIIGEKGKFQDWGGETSDLFTTRLKRGNKRLAAAFALTPGKMGKNGDQIQRLVQAPAEVFLVQYCRQIDGSVLSQLADLVRAKAGLTGQALFYGIIDGFDSARLVKAYPKAFTKP